MAVRGSEAAAPVYRLVVGDPPQVSAPRLDPTQQAVVDHPAGPLLVLAGPGTGKTTTIVEAVAGLARHLDIEVVAEGVETPEAAAQVRSLGCQLAQGHHFAHSMPPELFPLWTTTRPRTLPAAVAPVLVGTGAAEELGSFRPGHALLCLVVSLALQVAVNFANDYSDGIRGTDADRVGPMRLVGSGVATPGSVKAAALAAFGVAAAAGWCSRPARPGGWWPLARSRWRPRGSTPAGRSPTATSASAR